MQGKQEHLPIHHNDSLLLQFIINEYIMCNREFAACDSHLSSLITETAKRRQRYPEKELHIVAALEKNLTSLAGVTLTAMQMFIWTHEGGHLGKLFSYSLHFQGSDNDLHQKMRRHSESSLHLAYQAKDQLALITESEERSKETLIPLEELFRLIAQELRMFGKLFDHAALLFSKDENVLFFLLKRRRELDLYCGEGYVVKLFHDFFANGIDEAQGYMIECYRKRGFDEVAASIATLTEELKAI